jgi:hypothetical protein
MPVRKIPKNYRSVTGYFPSNINKRSIAYESSLESDFYLLLDYDGEVQSYEEQPFAIKYSIDGKTSTYTPDCLIRYKEHLNKKPVIAEIKYSGELKEKKNELEKKFTAIERYAYENEMLFKIYTEKDIRGHYLEKAEILPTLWYLVRLKIIKTELTKPLSYKSILEVEDGNNII